MKKKEWKNRARLLESELDDLMQQLVQLWDIASEKGERNGVLTLVEVVRRRMIELQQLRVLRLSANGSLLLGQVAPQPEEQVCSGRNYSERGECQYGCKPDWGHTFPCYLPNGCGKLWARVWWCQHHAEPRLPSHVRSCKCAGYLSEST